MTLQDAIALLAGSLALARDLPPHR
jgi:hypothetical protein